MLVINLPGETGLGKTSEKRHLRIIRSQLDKKVEESHFIQLIKDSLKFHDFRNIPFKLLEKDMGLDDNNIN